MRVLLWVMGAGLGYSCGLASGQFESRVLGLEGARVLGDPAGARYGSILVDSFNDQGVAVFSDDLHVHRYRPGDGTFPAARVGDLIPGGTGAQPWIIVSVDRAQVSDSGLLVYEASFVADPFSEGIVVDDGVGASLLVSQNLCSGVQTLRSSSAARALGRSVTDDGRVGFICSDPEGSFLSLAQASGVTDVYRERAQAPGLEDGVLISQLTNSAMNNRAQFVTLASLTGEGVNSSNDLAIYRSGPSGEGYSLIGREGGPIPGLPDGVRFGPIDGLPAINDAGDLAVYVNISGVNSLLRIDSDGLVSIELESGQPLPRFPDLVFQSGGRPQLAADGTLVTRVVGNAPGVGTDILYALHPTRGATVIAAEGWPAPGVPGGTITAIEDFDLDVSEAGRVAFLASAAVDGGSVIGLFSYDPLSGSRLVGLVGDAVDVSTVLGGPSDLRPIGGYSRRPFINNSGEIVIAATFGGIENLRTVLLYEPDGCGIADVAEPFGMLDMFDIDRFVDGFLGGTADLARPFATIDLSDLDAFLESFLAGCL
ncbi:MAG: hypothetical protein AAGI53_16615 [Planctomycetota bacterium]